MTEQSLLPPLDEAPERVAVPQSPRPRDPVPWLYALGFLVLAGALAYLWQYPTVSAETVANTAAVHSMEQRLGATDERLNRLEQRPTVDLGKLTARLDAVEGRIGDQTQLASRLDTLSGRIESLSGRNQTGIDGVKQQIDGLTSRIAAIEGNAGNLDAVTKRLNRIAMLQKASLALAAGRPVGDLPGAPEALARYAHAAPPTEFQLRVRFARDEEAALATKQPDALDAPFVNRVWERAQALITVRRGNEIVVGNSAAIILNHARDALDAGDLGGAVSAVETMKGQPANEMSSWLNDAKALMSARSALGTMADQA